MKMTALNDLERAGVSARRPLQWSGFYSAPLYAATGGLPQFQQIKETIQPFYLFAVTPGRETPPCNRVMIIAP